MIVELVLHSDLKGSPATVWPEEGRAPEDHQVQLDLVITGFSCIQLNYMLEGHSVCEELYLLFSDYAVEHPPLA